MKEHKVTVKPMKKNILFKIKMFLLMMRIFLSRQQFVMIINNDFIFALIIFSFFKDIAIFLSENVLSSVRKKNQSNFFQNLKIWALSAQF